MKMNWITLVSVLLSFPFFGTAQESAANGLRFEVDRVYPAISLTKEKLIQAQQLIDLNPYYKPLWVREYISVEITVSQNGKTVSAKGKDNNLTPIQKGILYEADVDKAIAVKVHYIPENNLKNNEPKETDFTFTIDPKNEAEFPGGYEQLKKYLKENAINKIAVDAIDQKVLAAIKFSIDTKGQINNVHIFESSKDEKTDDLLMTAIRNMPNWKPAEYSNGLIVPQEFVLTVGNMESCVVNLLSIRRA